MKKALITFLACTLAVMFSGCAGNTDKTAVTEQVNSSAQEPVSSEPAQAQTEAEEGNIAAAAEDSEETGTNSEDTTGVAHENSDNSGSTADSGEKSDSTADAAEDTTGVNDDEPAGDEEETGTSPLVIWGFEGYVDECEGYTWRKEFINCDYDGDGKQDRVNRSWNTEEQTADYTIEFGNGERLVVPPVWETGFPHIQSGDLDGDGDNEIMVSCSYDTGTDPMAYGELMLFDKDGSSGQYNEVELPFISIGMGSKALELEYDKPEDNVIHYTVKVIGFSGDEEVDEDYIHYWWTDEATAQARVVFHAEITEGSEPVLRCYFAPLPRWGQIIGFNLEYTDGRYEITDMRIDSPYD